MTSVVSLLFLPIDVLFSFFFNGLIRQGEDVGYARVFSSCVVGVLIGLLCFSLYCWIDLGQFSGGVRIVDWLSFGVFVVVGVFLALGRYPHRRDRVAGASVLASFAFVLGLSVLSFVFSGSFHGR